MQHQNKKTSSAVKKNIICQREFLKKIAQCQLKNNSRGYFTTDINYWVINSIREQNLHDVG